MADDGVKISALNEILTAPATGEYVAIAKAGASYKRDLGLLPSTTQKSALAGYGGTPSGTNPYATQTGATSIATALATPLSDLSRVMRINGDGVPTFPDNVAGTYQKYVGFTSSPVYVSGATAIVENGALKLTITTTGNWFAIFPDVTEYNSALLQIEYSATPARSVSLVSGGITWTLIASQQTTGSRQVLTGYTGIQNRHLEINNTGWSVGDVVYIYSEYIGSGLYDTPVYGKDGQTVAVNHGVVPVNGKRGKALLFQGAQYLESPNKLGTSGVIAFKYNRKTLGANEHICSCENFASHKGVTVFISNAQQLAFVYGNGTADTTQLVLSDILTGEEHSYVLNYTGTTIGPVYRDGILVCTQTALSGSILLSDTSTYIGRPAWGMADMLNGQLDDILVQSTPMTQDDAIRYHNGDDAVDSQQKAITNVPNAIKVCDSKGNIRQPGLPVYADNTAALAGGLVAGEPYRTSTGVLMVVY